MPNGCGLLESLYDPFVLQLGYLCLHALARQGSARCQKEEGQRLLDVAVGRHPFLKRKVSIALCLLEEPLDAVFIRVPVISEIMSPKVGAGSVVWEPKVGQTEAETAVAVVQDDLLATAFHPELTRDDGLHQYKHVLQVIVIALY